MGLLNIFKKWLKTEWFQFFIFFLFFVTIRFLPFLLGKTLIFGDNYSLMIPGKIFTAEWLKQGVLPLWNPYIFSGMPWMADINQSVFYPSTLLFMVFSPVVAFNLLLVSHSFIAFTGMYFLAKKWVKDHWLALLAGVLWMFSARVTESLNNISILQSLVWLPLLSYFGLRLVKESKVRIWFAVVVMLQFLGGYPQHVIYGIGLAVVLSGFDCFVKSYVNDSIKNQQRSQSIFSSILNIFSRENRQIITRWLKAWVVTAALVFGLSAVAWVPFVDMLGQSTRMEQTAEQALVGSLNPAMMIKFILPYFFDNPSSGMKWGPAWTGESNVGIYVTWLGWVVIGLSLFVGKNNKKIADVKNSKSLKKDQALFLEKWSKEKIFFTVVTISTLVFSLGQYLPGFSFIQKIFPFFRIARYPSMVMIATNIVVILWVIRALKNLQIDGIFYQIFHKNFSRFLWLGISSLVVGLVGVSVWSYGFETAWKMMDSFVSSSLSNGAFHTLERDKVILFEISKNIVFNSIFFITSLYFLKAKKTRIVIFILVLEMLVNTQGMLYFAPSKIYDTMTSNSQKIMQKMQLRSGLKSAEGSLRNSTEKELENNSNDGFINGRVLTRNSNVQYTDYSSYWEAMLVREPFSDSFVDDKELQEFRHAQNLKDGMTPNWNMVFGVPVVNGYATLLPKTYAKLWQVSNSPRINLIDYVDPSGELLDEWAVKYYLVDTWFMVEEDLSDFINVGEVGVIEKVGEAGGNVGEGEWDEENEQATMSEISDLEKQSGRWQILERENALDRFRFEDGSSEGIFVEQENPRRIDVVIQNDQQYEALIVADRYDVDWRVFVNGDEQTIENFHGMRKIMLDNDFEEQRITMVYCPKWLVVGMVVSGVSFVGVGGWLWKVRKLKKKV